MRIGVDFDGTISRASLYNPNLKLPWCLFLILVPLILSWPNKKTIEELKRAEAEGDEIIVISARPKQVANLTKLWLKLHQVPFDQLFCVGFGKGTKQRKLAVIQKEGIEVFIEDDRRILRFLEENSVKGRHTL